MTALSTVSAGAKPPTSLPTQLDGRHDANPDFAALASGGKTYNTAGTGVPETILDVSGVGIIQFVYAGSNVVGGPTTLELIIDGVTVYDKTRSSNTYDGLAACGSVFIDNGTQIGGCVYGNYVFTQSFKVIVTTTNSGTELIANYYLTS